MMNKIEISSPIPEIPKYDYDKWNINHSCFDCNDLDFEDFFGNFMIKNIPCLIRNVACEWECTKKWVENNKINYNYICDEYGDLDAPIADCTDIEFNSHSKCDMKVSEYMKYLKCHKDGSILYLKDWHLRRNRPNDNFYEIPSQFTLDWLNEFAIDNKEDDFMFVYIGPKGSWTPLHEDVYCSYSWSVNIVGKKKWILFPPGQENKLKDTFGNLPLTFEAEKHENIKYFEIIQEQGDAMFIPSGWHHQVVNELDTISVNHNWVNACNIHIVWTAIQNSLSLVEQQIEEFKDTPEFSTDCQLVLKSLFGMDFNTFIKFLCYIARKRIKQLQGELRMGLSGYCLGINIIQFELGQIYKVMESIRNHPVFLSKFILPAYENDVIEIQNDLSEILYK